MKAHDPRFIVIGKDGKVKGRFDNLHVAVRYAKGCKVMERKHDGSYKKVEVA
jgi:hypothetical protein